MIFSETKRVFAIPLPGSYQFQINKIIRKSDDPKDCLQWLEEMIVSSSSVEINDNN